MEKKGPAPPAPPPAPPAAQTCVNWDDDMDDFMPPNPWPPTHDVPPPLHESKIRKETKGKSRGSTYLYIT